MAGPAAKLMPRCQATCLYPEFDDHCSRRRCCAETYLFFDELLKHDMSLTNLVASISRCSTAALAKHYSIALPPLPSGERGRGEGDWEFRKVKLPPESHRGGVLTMGERASR